MSLLSGPLAQQIKAQITELWIISHANYSGASRHVRPLSLRQFFVPAPRVTQVLLVQAPHRPHGFLGVVVPRVSEHLDTEVGGVSVDVDPSLHHRDALVSQLDCLAVPVLALFFVELVRKFVHISTVVGDIRAFVTIVFEE